MNVVAQCCVEKWHEILAFKQAFLYLSNCGIFFSGPYETFQHVSTLHMSKNLCGFYSHLAREISCLVTLLTRISRAP